MSTRRATQKELGIATIEFAVTASFFLMMIVVVVAGGHFFWTHNALVEATRRGARYAANNCNPNDTACPGFDTVLTRIKNVVIYNDPNPATGITPFVPNLQPSNITVSYSERPGAGDTETFGVGAGSVSIKITGYSYDFILSPTMLNMPPYETTVRGESAGYQADTNVCP